MPSVYSLDSVVNNFFLSHTSILREECDKLATSLLGGPVSPVPIQGAFSYTVQDRCKESRLVQFRTQCSVLDLNILRLAKTIHGRFVADCIYHQTIGKTTLLHIYEIQKLPGLTYIEARCKRGISTCLSMEELCRQSNTVTDLAR
jgi:hypothetical protein